jgi:hypothetical protein
MKIPFAVLLILWVAAGLTAKVPKKSKYHILYTGQSEGIYAPCG